jgi:LysR family glycine cleavage system transcriptional activator
MHRVDFAREDVDIAVRHGDGDWAGLHVERLCAEQLFPVCSPRLVRGRQRLIRPSDVLKFPLLHLQSRKDWATWLDLVGVPDAEGPHGPVMSHASLLIDAAAAGQGIALARTTLAAWDLLNGRLIRPFPDVLRLSKPYWVVCPRATAMLPKVKRAREWLLSEAADDARRLKALWASPQNRR